jgi:hypothetical protein
LIVGVDPASVRQHLAAIDTELGPDSPGIASLSTLIDQAEQAVSTASPTTTKRQHVISQVVMRYFVEEVRPHGIVLARVDLGTGKLELTGTKGTGYVDNFVPVDSQRTEALWQQVEDKLKPAVAAALVGTACGNPTVMSTLRNAVALHFVRNPQALEVHHDRFTEALEAQIGRLAQTPFAAEAFYRQHGLLPAGPEAMRMGAEASQERVLTLYRQGGLFRISVQNLYEKVCDRFDLRGIEILTPASAGKEFLLGDVPAITIAPSGTYGLAQGITVDEADKIVMPLTPHMLVAIGPPNGSRQLTDAEVDSYNTMQVRQAREYVLHRPAANFAASIAAWRT